MSNIEKIRSALKGAGLDGILLTGAVNRRWATGFNSSAGAVVVGRDKAYYFTDSRYIEAARAAVTEAEVLPVSAKCGYKDRINGAVKDCGIKILGFEDQVVSYAEYLEHDKNIEAQLRPAQKIMSELRAVKDEAEIGKMIAAQRISERALDDVLGIIKPGVTEKDVAAELIYRMLKYGAENMSFDPIVVSGAKSSMPHGVPGENEIQKGGFVTMDFGCTVDGYCSDMTRTVAVGEATEEMLRVYDIVLRAQLAGIEAAREGVTGREIDAAAREVINGEGYGDFFGHGFGHSLGLEVHESPNAAPSDEIPMPRGAVISAEPGIYLPGKFGVRIEDVIVIGKNRSENITKAPKELIIL